VSAPGRPLLPWSFRNRTEDLTVRPLEPADVAALRLPWQSRFSPASLTAFLERRPGYGWIAPGSGEFLLAEPWRRRDDIAGILEIHARRGRPALLARAAADLAATGARALLLPDGEWTAAPRVYEEQGFARVERVVYFQLLGLGVTPQVTRPLPPLEFAPLTPHHLATIVRLDHAAFPWLWWNAEAEFRSYYGQAGVQVWLGWMAGAPVAYAGFTTLDRWGHLDRLAVDPAAQGRSYGAAMLAFALARMAALNVNRVTLSTQETNTQSQRLYRGFGFRQTTERFDIYCKWLARPQ
jgi:ribosomal protein S18 acetylase RimI-like enzyme